MRYGSLFSGIEAATVAWAPLGWTCAWVAETDPFASAVLAHRYPQAPNLGDVNAIDAAAVEPVDLVVFGSPCQSFSVAGKRLGLDDPRGNMALVGLRVVGKLRPRWVVWENVPGVLSSDNGRDFGAFLGLLGELGYGAAYRVLDAQHFGVPQRRRRVFVVGCLGDWRPPAALLFEQSCLQWNPAPRREAGQGVARPVASCAPGGSGYRCDADTADNLIAGHFEQNSMAGRGSLGWNNGDQPLRPVKPQSDHQMLVTHSLRADGFDASEDGTGRGTPLTLAIRGREGNQDLEYRQDGTANAILTPSGGRGGIGVLHAGEAGAAAPLDRGSGVMSVRRLTPRQRECERLQGLPDDYTLVPYRGKPAADGPRYRAVGNSFAVPVIRWIGMRLELFERTREEAA